MNIAVISDSHDNIPNIKKALNYLAREKVGALIHCGDVSTPATARYLAEHFSEPIYLSFGNTDCDQTAMSNLAQEKCNNLIISSEAGSVRIGGREIAFVHYPISAKDIASAGKHEIVFYGHSHKPWEETVGKTRLVNPGNLANLFYKPSFAMYNTKSGALSLILLETI